MDESKGVYGSEVRCRNIWKVLGIRTGGVLGVLQ